MELTSSTLVDKLMPELSTLFDTIRDQSRDGAGVTRDAFGPRETQAADTLATGPCSPRLRRVRLTSASVSSAGW